MTRYGFKELVRLKMSVKDVNNFTPPKGLDINWFDYDYYNDEVTACITGSEWCPQDTYFVYKEEVNHMLSKLKVAQDGIRDSTCKLPNVRNITTYTGHVKDQYDHLLSNSKITNTIIDKPQLNDLKKYGKIDAEEFYDKHNRKRFKVQMCDIKI